MYYRLTVGEKIFHYTKVTRNGNKVKNHPNTKPPPKKPNQPSVHGELRERTQIITIIHTQAVVGHHTRYISVSDKVLYL